MKPIIGILGNFKKSDGVDIYENYYKIVGLYVDRLNEEGAIPLGILNADTEVLDKCDGFLFTGGNRITKNHYKIIEYALKNNKPLLGICAGMQAMAAYDYLYNECLNENIIPNYENIYNKQEQMEKQKKTVLSKIENHGKELSSGEIEASIDNINKYVHRINIKEDSILYNIYKKNTINVVSMHGYGVYETTSLFKEIAYSEDKVVEAIEYKNKNFILGIQFHIEMEPNNLIMKKFVKKCSEGIKQNKNKISSIS